MAYFNLEYNQVNIILAFLNAKLKEIIYIEYPYGFKLIDGLDNVY